MENYRAGAHNRFDIKYHFVWVTKYRRKVLTGEVGLRVRELVREVCLANEIEYIARLRLCGSRACAAVVPADTVAEQSDAVYQGQEFQEVDDGVQA